MKYLRRFNESINRSEIDTICEKYNIEHYTINDDGTIDVDGDVYLNDQNLSKLPLKFGKVSGSFNCSNNLLTSLKGAPAEVGRDFRCGYNRLTSLKYAPKYVGRDFYCSYNNQMTSLDGFPQYIGEHVHILKNNLISLKGLSKRINGELNCSGNNIKNVDYLPMCKYLYIVGNPISKIFELFDNNKIYIYDFKDSEIIQNDIVLIDRLVEFLEDIGEPRTKEFLQNLLQNEYEIR